ncbi:MAG: YceI family protein [Flavobacteriaceae bacterium]|jgi:polyisoprenoid-binding protein YceI|nr:YceI family protein [Flavobacteriaceae bacterium]
MSTQKWVIDPTHSEITFKVKHMMITNVSGLFSGFTAEIESSDDSFENSKVSFSAETATVDTKNEQRDEHLRSADFFDSENYSELKFTASGYDASSGQITGDLTIKDVTKSVTLEADFGGVNKDPWGNVKAGFTFSGKINRKDFGLNWNTALEAGGVLVSDDVRISCDVQFVKQ